MSDSKFSVAAVRTGTTITMVDLDLDVIRYEDGTVELVDEDEFNDYQVRYGYPDELIAGAIVSGQHVLGEVEADRSPFDAPPERWLEILATLASGSE